MYFFVEYVYELCSIFELFDSLANINIMNNNRYLIFMGMIEDILYIYIYFYI